VVENSEKGNTVLGRNCHLLGKNYWNGFPLQASGRWLLKSKPKLPKTTLATPEDLTAHLVLPETFVSRTRRTGEVTHATLLREPRSLTAQSFLVLVRDDEDPTARFHRVCDGLITTPLHPTWAPWLWQWATQSGALQALQSVGCRAWRGCVDEVQLEKVLSSALANGLLCIPSAASPERELSLPTPR